MTKVKFSYRCSFYRSQACPAKLEFYASTMDYDFANMINHTYVKLRDDIARGIASPPKRDTQPSLPTLTTLPDIDVVQDEGYEDSDRDDDLEGLSSPYDSSDDEEEAFFDADSFATAADNIKSRPAKRHSSSPASLVVHVRIPPASTAVKPPAPAETRVAHDAAQDPRKRRRRDGKTTTYAARKEELRALRDEMQALETQLKALQRRVVSSSEPWDRGLLTKQHENDGLRAILRAQQLALGTAQSIMSQHLTRDAPHPLKHFIRLSADTPSRHATLLAMRRERIEVALRFVDERLRHLDIKRPYHIAERYVGDDGKSHLASYHIIHFPGARSVRQVYDAMRYYLSTMEISVSEKLGHLTILEDMDALEDNVTVWSTHVASTTTSGVVMEVNAANFAEFIGEFDPAREGAPCGVLCANTIDEDELRPYRPRERVRKDISAAAVFSAFRRPRRATDDDSELVVVMKRCAMLTLHKPHFELSCDAMEEINRTMLDWGDVMIKSMRDIVYGCQPRCS
ncbi:hypothetical protein ATCC90586_006447 [Pythium insidiosum]|nr:hypothetical protein ATCC90586_006447 [Pythium insidiosum]